MVTGIAQTSGLLVAPSLANAERFTYYRVGEGFSKNHPYLTKVVAAIYSLANRVLYILNYLERCLKSRNVTKQQTENTTLVTKTDTIKTEVLQPEELCDTSMKNPIVTTETTPVEEKEEVATTLAIIENPITSMTTNESAEKIQELSPEEFAKLFDSWVEEAKADYRKHYLAENGKEPTEETINQYFRAERLEQLKASLEHFIRSMTPEQLDRVKDRLNTTNVTLGMRALIGVLLGASVGYGGYKLALSFSQKLIPFINSFETSSFFLSSVVSIPTLFHVGACLHKLPGSFRIIQAVDNMTTNKHLFQTLILGDLVSCALSPQKAISSVARSAITTKVSQFAAILKNQALSRKGLCRQSFEQGYGVGFFGFQAALIGKTVWDSGILFTPYAQAAAIAYCVYAACEWKANSTKNKEV